MQIVVSKLFFVIIDFFIINFSILAAQFIRFGGQVPNRQIYIFLNTFILVSLIKIIVFYLVGIYNSLWRYASIEELMQIFFATIISSIASYIYGSMVNMAEPRSVYMISGLITFFLLGASRISFRIARRAKNKTFRKFKKEGSNIMIIGAGMAGSTVIKELLTHEGLNATPVLVIDDDKAKHKSSIHGVPVKGDRTKIVELAKKYAIDEIIVAMPASDKKNLVEILNICKATKCKLRKLPGIYEIINGQVSIKDIRDVSIEDILGRDEVTLNTEEISGYLQNEVVLITGGGGSIGSELCRQIARYNPKQIIILDIYENNAYDIQNELLYTYKGRLDLKVLIASVRDVKRMEQIFDTYKPGVVFHAAAHKHVVLMEENACEAIKNNVRGTLNIAQCADKYGVKKFVLISTDKAVNPTNIMGATKRITEMIIQSINKTSKTEFSAVRFGNVLGSNGSVIPIFKKQISQGGPVTVTHPDITRFFMTIPEASRLVIQAGAMAKGGEIFILDMGEPVKISDLAKDIIRLSGFEPDVDIKIEYTGLRKGEKLYEELLLDEEGIQATKHEKIYVAKPLDLSFSEVLFVVKSLENYMHDDELLRQWIASVVPTYKGSGVEVTVAKQVQKSNLNLKTIPVVLKMDSAY